MQTFARTSLGAEEGLECIKPLGHVFSADNHRENQSEGIHSPTIRWVFLEGASAWFYELSEARCM